MTRTGSLISMMSPAEQSCGVCGGVVRGGRDGGERERERKVDEERERGGERVIQSPNSDDSNHPHTHVRHA